jgi:hypothetical protein
MSSDRLSELHEVLRDSLRQEILLRLGRFGSLDFDGLKKKLKLVDSAGLSSQLGVLQELTVEGEHLVIQQGLFYDLTEKGHAVLDELLAFPDLAADDYNELLFGDPSQSGQPRVKPRWFTPYWAFLFISTAIVVGFVFPYFGNQSFSKALGYLLISLGILGFGYYVRVRPSVKINKFVYIVILGFGFLGCAFWMAGLILSVFVLRVPHAAEDTLFVVLTTLSFTLGPIVGYLIGKARNFKGPEKYSP